ncbi:MAG: glycosyltransferase [Rhodospirillaceae bacterium]|jgi:glycosyltransferase involved in cell wall biosynthesis|nr:glycosyltransferase [Rhodospirillaceae bacterium]MBT5297426.1 glycosyltransferase [Rhodospirillaceae bacterium]MBT5513744.1 glycosyltransferase [Rhodospirillaceae bacterium]MBT6086653.1 glycosyltransferase [Rhodospirillaceae bacterium]MBT6610055.1 glycosyltransferase [Rhodospirillaceae bacterium]
MSGLVSIIIRAFNEERWIGPCLRAIQTQTYTNFEVILVDNNSTDKTVERAKEFDVVLINIDKFIPGQAINDGIRASKGEIIICISAHCIPVDENWLANLIADLDDAKVAGVYGRQEPLSFSTDYDKRDLITVFGLDKKVQRKDPFFHNANSAFRRDTWEKFPFSETATNIEDRVWGQQVIAAGYKIVYEPDASVYHHHGIHHNQSAERVRDVVMVMEGIENWSDNAAQMDPANMNIVAMLPVKSPVVHYGGRPLLEYSIENALASELISHVVVAADNEEHLKIAQDAGCAHTFLRPESLSAEYADVVEVFRFTLESLEDAGVFPDIVVMIEETYPFRPAGLLDEMIRRMTNEGLESVVAARPEQRHIWLKDGEDITDVGDGFMPRHLKSKTAYIALIGLANVTLPSIIRGGARLGERIGLHEIVEPLAGVEVHNDQDSGLPVGAAQKPKS